MRVVYFRPPKPYAAAAAGEPLAPAPAGRRRPRRDDRRRGDRRGVDGRRRGPRPLARHPRPRSRAGRARHAGRLRRALARGDRRGARRRRVPPRPRAGRGRRAGAVRALEVRRRRHQRRGPLLPRDRLGAALDRPHRRVLRPPPGLPRGAHEGGRVGRRGADPRPRPAHRQGLRARRGARRVPRPAATPGSRCSSISRRCCTRRRWWSTARGPRWAPSTSTTAPSSFTTRSRSASPTSTSPGCSTEAFENDLERSERIDPDRWDRRGPVQRLGEAASTLLRREL